MQRLLLSTCVLVTVFFTGVLYGNCGHHERSDSFTLKQAYGLFYPVSLPTITFFRGHIPYNFVRGIGFTQ
jgi:hypothetical protein